MNVYTMLRLMINCDLECDENERFSDSNEGKMKYTFDILHKCFKTLKFPLEWHMSLSVCPLRFLQDHFCISFKLE